MEFLTRFLERFSYPPEACAALLAAHQRICACPQAADVFSALCDAYCAGVLDYAAANKEVVIAAQAAEVHEYTALLLFYLRLAQPLEALYAQRAIAPEIYKDTLSDLRYKAWECYTVHGVWGTFVAFWNEGFFNLTRFALGRLQYELSLLPCDCTVQGVFLSKGTQVVNVHIPSSGPLRKEDCEASFAQAKSFFGRQTTIFMCDSWLLFPAHRDFLPQHSNILMFMDFFTIVSQKETTEFRDAWRVFGKPAEPPYTDLPEETSLQRAYAAWLRAGNCGGTGVGVFIQ